MTRQKDLSRGCSIYIFLLFITLSINGCSWLEWKLTPRVAMTMESLDEAGSIHVSVLSVEHWDKYKKDLQPKFPMTASKALTDVIPNTSNQEEKFLDAIQMRAKIATPTLSESSTDTFNSSSATTYPRPITGENPLASSTEKESSQGSQSTVERKPGDISGLTPEDSIVGDRRASQLFPQGDKSVLNKELGMDPMMRYWAATALFQEVQLLNKYIEHAAIGEGYEPYVVRLQVNVIPSARYEPYDAYTTISLFSEPGIAPAGTLEKSQTSLRAFTDILESPADQSDISTTITPIIKVVPLLVTDNIESMMHSRSVNRLRQLSLNLLTMVQGITGQLGFQRFSEDLQSLLGKDLNSLLTVGRVSDNTLRVRLGAMHQGGIDYAMVPRAHNISFLLLVPKGDGTNSRNIQGVAISNMVDAITGVPLRHRTEEEVNNKYNDILREYGLYSGFNDSRSTKYREELRKLYVNAQQNDWKGFKDNIEAIQDMDELKNKLKVYQQQAWADLTSIKVGSKNTSLAFIVPKPPEKKESKIDAFSTQTFFAMDNGTNKTTITLKEGKELTAKKLLATIYVQPQAHASLPKTTNVFSPAECKPAPLRGYFPLIAEQVSIIDSGKLVKLTFPSLQNLGLVNKANKKPLDMKLAVSLLDKKGDPEKNTCISGIYLANVKEEKTPIGFSVTITAGVITAEQAEGTVRLAFKKTEKNKAKKIKLFIKGAGIKEIKSKTKGLYTLNDSDQTISINKDGALDLTLKNLNTEIPVHFSTKNENGKGPSDIVLKVVELKKGDKAKKGDDAK